MQRSPEPQQAKRGRLMAAGLAAAGFGLTLLIFYPGIMTYDAKFVYEDIAKHTLGDWQSPVMTVLWALIDPVAPGSASMFLLIAAVYWLAFGVLGFTLAGRSAAAGRVAADFGAIATGLRSRRRAVARRAVRGHLAARGRADFRRHGSSAESARRRSRSSPSRSAVLVFCFGRTQLSPHHCLPSTSSGRCRCDGSARPFFSSLQLPSSLVLCSSSITVCSERHGSIHCSRS